MNSENNVAKAEEIENNVTKAEEIIKDIYNGKKDITKYEGKRSFKIRPSISTNKIRNILSFVSEIYNIEIYRSDSSNAEKLTEKSQRLLRRMRIRVAYEAGRDKEKGNPTGEFIKITEILKKIRNIEEAEYSKKKFMDFEEYMEALVAYHSYYYPNKGDNN